MIRDVEKDNRNAVVVRERAWGPIPGLRPRTKRWRRLETRAEVAEHTRQVIIPTERKHV
jgi:hypothetical protein